jgi:hypothetical protein
MSTINLSIGARAGSAFFESYKSPKMGTLKLVLLSPKTAPLTDLWATLEGVFVIFMRLPYYNFCSL